MIAGTATHQILALQTEVLYQMGKVASSDSHHANAGLLRLNSPNYFQMPQEYSCVLSSLLYNTFLVTT
jgi:hypothetical protein